MKYENFVFLLVILVFFSFVYWVYVNDKAKCKHKFVVEKTTDFYDISFGSKSYMYTKERSRCSVCGEIKTQKFRG